MTKALDNSAAARDLAHQIHGFTDLAHVTESELMVITEGEGIYVRDDRGRRYLDCTAGMYCTALGFSEKELAEAAYAQMLRLPTYHTLLATTTPPSTALAEKLVEITPEKLTRVFLVNSGSEANDTIVKLIWYYNNALGRPEKKKIISRMGSYHGTTVAAASLTGIGPMQMGFDVPLKGFLKVDGPHMFRAMAAGEDEGAYATRLLRQVEDLILAEGPETVAAMVVDPIASSSGFQLSPNGYFERLQALLRKHDVLFVTDEVISGFGRTGNMFACETFGLEPDLMSMAKGLCSAYLPIAAVAVSEEIFGAMVKQSESIGMFFQAFTTAGHPTTSAVALRNIELMEERAIIDHVAAVSPHFLERLQAMCDHPLVGEAHGIGLAGAVELVADKATNAPFDPARLARIRPLMRECGLAHGLIPRGMAERQAFAPPLIITSEQIDEMFDLFSRTLDDVSARLRDEGAKAA